MLFEDVIVAIVLAIGLEVRFMHSEQNTYGLNVYNVISSIKLQTPMENTKQAPTKKSLENV